MDIALGQVVKSKAGRDTGRKFVVIEVVDDMYVLVSDGDLRRLEKPKKKKLKHLDFTGEVIETLREKLISKLKVSNSEIRKAIAALEENSGEREA